MAPLNVLMVGTGEYTTGFVGGGMSGSDKKVGVVGLTLFDLRRRGKVNNLSMVGTTGTKFPAIRTHLQKNITDVYNGLDTSFTSFPSDTTSRDPEAYHAAISALSPGDAVTIFTPDPTHYAIALAAIKKGCHVLLTKPATKLLEHHIDLLAESRKAGVFVFIEHHKRFDPAYADARHKAKTLGEFGYFYAFMSQPKSQLETFKAWAGKDSDISYYLNSHHVDVCASMVIPLGWSPTQVTANAAKGVAEELGCAEGTEDTITLTVRWEKASKVATGVYTASWTAPLKEGVHSNQFFHYMASAGSINTDQAHRGYQFSADAAAQTAWLNPFYMRYAPDEDGNFAGQTGYGYISIEKFIDAAAQVNDAKAKGGDVLKTLESLDAKGEEALPTLKNTIVTTAILEAGRRSLDERRTVGIERVGEEWRLA